MNALIWNIRSVITQKAFTRLINMHKRYQFTFIGLMEPFQKKHNVEKYRKRLGLQNAIVNASGQIWASMDSIMEYTMISDEEQELTIRLENHNDGVVVIVTLMQAKCNQADRLQLWDFLGNMASTIQYPWMVGGDFNVIRSVEENLGGLSIIVNKIDDFNHCLNICNLEEAPFKESKFTWWKRRIHSECIFKRLDRVVSNDKF